MKKGFLFLTSFATGLSKELVEVVKETPKRYKIRAINRTRLAGLYRYLKPGETAYVPKHAVKLVDDEPAEK